MKKRKVAKRRAILRRDRKRSARNLESGRKRRYVRFSRLQYKTAEARAKKQRTIQQVAYTHTTVPERFSIVRNTTETLAFFGKLREIVSKGENPFLDLAGVSEITPDAVIYLISQFIAYKQSHPGVIVGGNVPEKREPNRFLAASGFFRATRSLGLPVLGNSSIFAVRAGRLADYKVARDLASFCSARLSGLSAKVISDFYVTLIEAMQNTKQHAYENVAEQRKSLSIWLLIAMYDVKRSEVHVCLLDNGESIPQTINKKIFDLGMQDGDLILSALRGEKRTKTGKKNRGKGLPKIYKSATKGSLAEFIVMSRRGKVTIGPEVASNIDGNFEGTMFYWTIKGTI